MNFVAVATVSAIVLGHPFNKSHLLIGLNYILLCLNNSSQITKKEFWPLPLKQRIKLVLNFSILDIGNIAIRAFTFLSYTHFLEKEN